MDDVEKLKNHALSLMEKEGFTIHKQVSVSLDPKLPFMGYTTHETGKPHIVIAAWALSTPMAMGLLIHELSHVYRTETNHPSHNGKLHQKILETVFGEEKLYPFQFEVIQNAINNLQDLYADDMSFTVYKKHLKLPNMHEFFLGWIHEILPVTSKENRWKNAQSLLNTSFAIANLKRHNIEDTDEKVKKAVKKFLQTCDKKLADAFPYFEKLMITLPDPITDEAFEVLLTNYLNRFISLT